MSKTNAINRSTENKAIRSNEVKASDCAKTCGEKVSRPVNQNYEKSVDCLVDDSFTPGEIEEVVENGHKRPMTADEQFLGMLESMDEEETSVGYWPKKLSDVEDGGHMVVIDEYRAFAGKGGNDPFLLVTLKDTRTLQLWNMIVTATKAEMAEFFKAITRYNSGLLNGLDAKQKFNCLLHSEFAVWTVYGKDRHGNPRISSYVDKDRYDRRLFAESHNKDRKDNDVPWRD